MRLAEPQAGCGVDPAVARCCIRPAGVSELAVNTEPSPTWKGQQLMDRLSELSRGTQLMLAASVLLLIDTFFAWQKVEVEVGGVEIASASQNAWNGFWGVALGLMTLLMIAMLVARIAAVDVPLPVSYAMRAAVLGMLIFLFALIKNLVDDYSTFWSYLGVVLAALVAIGAYLQVQEEGGVDNLRSEATSYGGSRTDAGATAAPPAATSTPEPPAPTATPDQPAPPSTTTPAASDDAPPDRPSSSPTA